MQNNINGTRSNLPSNQDLDTAARPTNPPAAPAAAGSAAAAVGERAPNPQPPRNTTMQASLMAAMGNRQDSSDTAMRLVAPARHPGGILLRPQQSGADAPDVQGMPGARMQALLLAVLEARQEIAAEASSSSSGEAPDSRNSGSAQRLSGNSSPAHMDWCLTAALAPHNSGRASLASSSSPASIGSVRSGISLSSMEESLDGLSHEELVASWARWASGGGNAENRGEAVFRMRAWLDETPDAELSLNNLDLTSLPEILPPGLQRLDISRNHFSHFPDQLPETLEILDISGNMPRLEQLPEQLPERLRALYIQENNLSLLPENLPEGLLNLEAFDNRLTRLPERLPAGLLSLDIRDNPLGGLPDNLPVSLRQLDAVGIGMTTLPESILLLHPDCIVDVADNPLSDRVRNRLAQLINSSEYEGPIINFSMSNGGSSLSDRPLSQAVAAWPLPPGRDGIQRTLHWQGFASEPGAAAFSRFLDRLAQTVNAGNPQFCQSIGQWLLQLEHRHELRQHTFLLSEGATASCDDRVCLTLNAMRQLRLADDVEQGQYDQRLPELLSLGRGMFRLDQLEGIAREKVASLNFVDEIEVYLAYQVKLREALALPLDVAEMRFFNVSYVTQDDLDAAQARVMADEQQGFADYLATQWQPWQSVLYRLEPQAYDAAREELNEAMGEPFANRLQARLQGMGLENDPDAERIVGPQVRVEIEREIMGRLTRDFLARHNLELAAAPG